MSIPPNGGVSRVFRFFTPLRASVYINADGSVSLCGGEVGGALFQGEFAPLWAHELGGATIKTAVARSGVAPELVV